MEMPMHRSAALELSRKVLAPLAAAMLALAAAQPSLAADEPDAPKGAAVTVLRAAKACFASIVEATGIIIPRQEAAVRPGRPGWEVPENLSAPRRPPAPAPPPPHPP